MKSFTTAAILFAFALSLAVAPVARAQKTDAGAAVPKYDVATETTFKGTVLETKDRECPVSGGLGSHLTLKLTDGRTIEVHLGSAKFLKSYDLVFNKGEKLEIVGTQVQFEGKETIFAREITRGSDTFAFRDKSGAPIW